MNVKQGNCTPTNDAIDRLFERYTAPGSPGCALAVIKDSEIAYQQGYGLANLEHEIPILPTTVFNIGSMAKQFTAFAIALLENEGCLSANDDLRQHLPEMHDFGHTIKIHHLIHHTSGLRGSFPELLALAGWRDSDTTTTDDVVRLLRAQTELNYLPGEEHLYVNSGYVLLALIVQRVSGQSFAAFCQERIFQPLGMSRTVVNDTPWTLISGRASGYYDDEGGWLNAPLTDSVVGPSNIYTSVQDLARWDQNFYTGEVGGKTVIERMHQPGRLNDSTELTYAYGLEVGQAHRGWQLVEHGGGQGGYGSWMLRLPEQRLSVVVLFNHFLWNMRDFAIKVADQFLEDAPGFATAETQGSPSEAPAAIELGPEQLQAMAGTYFNAQRVTARQVTCTDDGLQYQGLALVPIDHHHFVFEHDPDARAEFVPGEKGAITGLSIVTPSEVYDYERVEAESPSPEVLAQSAGRYYSPELEQTWTLVSQEDHLVAKRHKYVDTKLMPLFADTFSDDWLPILGYPTTYLILFERDEGGAISGFRISGTRVRNLRFIRQVP